MKKILVIFLFSIIMLFLIFNKTYKNENKILLITDDISAYNKYNNKIQLYIYDNISYKELINAIKSNDSKIIKEKEIYLNQLISKSNYLIIDINNKVYNKKCLTKKNMYNYNYLLTKDIENLKNVINRFSNTKIIIIKNSCKIPKDYTQLNYLIENT